MFQPNKFCDNWVDDLQMFFGWLHREQERCVPRGMCVQSVDVTSGAYGLRCKYPTFEDAYKAYKEEMDSIET